MLDIGKECWIKFVAPRQSVRLSLLDLGEECILPRAEEIKLDKMGYRDRANGCGVSALFCNYVVHIKMFYNNNNNNNNKKKKKKKMKKMK